MFTILLKKEGEEPQRITVEGSSAVLGRNPACDVVVSEPFVSNRHLRILQGLIVADLGSRNGTFLDGVRLVDPVRVDGLTVTIGQGQLEFEVLSEGTFDADSAAGYAGSSEPQAAELVSPQATELAAQLVRLEDELEAARKREAQWEAQWAAEREAAQLPGPDAGSDTTELERLRAQVAELEAERDERAAEDEPLEPPEGASASTILIFKLQEKVRQAQSRERELEAELAQAKSAASGAAPHDDGPALAALKRERDALAARLAALEAAPRPAAPAAAQPMPARHVGAGDAYERILSDMVQNDVESLELAPASSVSEFVFVSTLRILRQMERVMTRMAGDFIQLYQLNTMLPDVQGNLRKLTGDMLAAPDDPGARAALTDYLQELGRWTVASLGAYRKSAVAFAAEIRDELGEKALTREHPIPKIKRIAGQREAELWKRVCDYVESLSPDIVEDRIESLARDAVQEILGRGGSL